MSKKQAILKHDDFSNLCRRFSSIDEQRFINCALIDVNQCIKIDSTEYYPVNVERYAEQNGITIGNAFKEMVDIAHRLKHYDFNFLGKDNVRWITSLIYDYKMEEDKKFLWLKWNIDVINLISGTMESGSYCYYDPRLDKTRSNRSYLFGEYLERNLWNLRLNGKLVIPISKIREVTGTLHNYAAFRDLDRNVIQPTLKDMKKYLNISLLSFHKKGEDFILIKPAYLVNAVPNETPALRRDE